LKLSADELERRTDLEKETIAEVRRILQEEFDKGE
jgi:N utilization substance protein A